MTSEAASEREGLRQQYLGVLGITQYIARQPLAGARPSVSLAALLAPTAAPAEPLAPERPAPARAPITVEPAPAARPAPATAAPARPAASPANATAFQCQLALWSLDDLLLIAETARLSPAQLALLGDLSLALGRPSPSSPEQYSWPLPQRRERSLPAARDHFQGWLEGGLLARPGLRQLVLFGDAPRTLLATGGETEASSRYHDWPLACLPALQALLDTPSLKPAAWRLLQPLARP